ncbi:MAG TPA: ABC transporter permease [Bryobacteraceae bacterium]
MNELFRKLAYYFRRRRFEEELDEEMRHHAELAGRKQFGNITRWKEKSRAMWGWAFFEQLIQDLRYAVRAMNNNRAFTALAALSLALGIGANTAIFSFMDAILLRALPVQDPESLVVLNWHLAQGSGASGSGEVDTSVVHGMSGSIDPDPRGGVVSGIFPYAAFETLQRNDAPFSSLFGYFREFGAFNVKVRGQAEMARADFVSGDYFRGLGVVPVAGRPLLNDDDRVGAPLAAVLGFAYGRKRFGDPLKAVGTEISINNVPATVIGVAPPEFFGVDPAGSPDLFVPLHSSLLLEPKGAPISLPAQYLDKNYYWLHAVARLRPGVTLAQARAALAPVFHEWVASTAANDKERADLPELLLQPGRKGVDSLRRQFSEPLFLLLALVGLILAISCANIANLLLARAAARMREMAVRLSVGATRLRVIRQLLTESVLLASVGGLLGILIAIWGIRFLTLLLANGQEGFILRAELNWHVLAAAAGLSMLTGILFGLAPAVQSTRVDAMPALKDGTISKPGRSRGLPRLLVTAQIAISLLVLVAAGLFVRTLSNLQSIQVGFNRENLLIFNVNARLAGHSDPEIVEFYENLHRQFQSIPGVRSASLSNLPMMIGGRMGWTMEIRGKQTPVIGLLAVGPSFLKTMQIPILVGHDIEDRGRAVAVVDEEFAKTYFPNENPIGQHLNLFSGASLPSWVRVPEGNMEIVGVSANASYGNVRPRPGSSPVVYYLYNRASFPPIVDMTFELRTTGNALTYVNAVREIVRRDDPGVPVSDVKTQAAEIREQMGQENTFARLSAAFAFLALAITCVGLYGTVSYNVARRTNEIGIRMALGAQRRRVVWMVLREVLLLIFAGFAIGILTALATSKLVGSFLYGMKPNDPRALIVAGTILLSAATLAGYGPARRASRIDPMAALRHE